MGENYANIMDNYFDASKKKMNNRFKISKKLVDYYKDNICFLVNIDTTLVQAIEPRVALLEPI